MRYVMVNRFISGMRHVERDKMDTESVNLEQVRVDLSQVTGTWYRFGSSLSFAVGFLASPTLHAHPFPRHGDPSEHSISGASNQVPLVFSFSDDTNTGSGAVWRAASAELNARFPSQINGFFTWGGQSYEVLFRPE